VHEEDATAGPRLDPSAASTLQMRLMAARGCNGGQESMWVELGHVKNATDILLSKAPRVSHHSHREGCIDISLLTLKIVWPSHAKLGCTLVGGRTWR
jgi:hypothetical protein